MLEFGQHLAAVRIHDGLKAILVLVGFFGDQTTLSQVFVGSREVRHVHGDVVAVVLGDRLVGLGEPHFLVVAHAHGRYTASAVAGQSSTSLIEACDSCAGVRRHLHVHVRHAQIHQGKGSGGIGADVVAPGAGQGDVIVLLFPAELGACHGLGDEVQPLSSDLPGPGPPPRCDRETSVRSTSAGGTAAHPG